MSEAIVIYDTEYTTWEGAMAANWAEDWQHRELVQVAAIRVELESFEITDRFDVFVKPVLNPVLSDFFVELTGITNEDITEKGLSFAEAFQSFADFVGKDRVYSYGADHVILNENCRLNKREDWVDSLPAASIVPYFEGHGVDSKKINSGKLSTYFGVDMAIREHNAMDDVYSIHGALKHLKDQGHEMPFKKREENAA